MDRRRSDTRERLVNAALEEIKANGHEKLLQYDLAKKVGISAVGFYYHFATKELLLQSVLKKASQEIYDLYLAQYTETDTGDPVDAMIRLGKFTVSLFQTQSNMMNFVFSSPVALRVYSNEKLAFNNYQNLFTVANKLIDEIISKYNIKTERHVLFVKWWSFLQGYSMLISASIAENADFYIEEAVHWVVAGSISQ